VSVFPFFFFFFLSKGTDNTGIFGTVTAGLSKGTKGPRIRKNIFDSLSDFSSSHRNQIYDTMNKSPLMKKVLNLFKKTHETNDDSPPYPVDLERTYRISKKVLGVGSFAVVKECFHKQTGQPYALKIILKKAIAGRLFTLPHTWHGFFRGTFSLC
jgi:hypothetical protein